jgi:hypothetical protein
MISGFGFGSASTHDQRLMETFLAARARPIDQLARVGEKAQGVYIADKGFAGALPYAIWRARFDAEVITPPHQSSKKPWPKEWRNWLAHLRQLVETVYEKLLNAFRLARERPHTLTGFQALYWLLGSSVREREPLGFHRSHLSGCQVGLRHRNCRGRVLIYQRNHACLGSGP